MGKEINYSFIIPHKNTPLLLQRCLDSIPQREDIEIIVVDNNSSPDIVDFNNYPSKDRPDVKMLQDNKSTGGGGARNTGLDQAEGKWVLFADADDYYSKGFIEILDKYNKKSLDVVYFNFNICISGKENHFPFSLKYLNDAFKENGDIDLLKYRLQVPWCKMVNREMIKKYDIHFEDSLVGNDILFSYYVGFCSNKIAVEPTPLYNYCIQSNSVTTNNHNGKDFYICKFTHYYQRNTFLRKVNHPEWTISALRFFVSIIKHNGFAQFCLAICTFFMHHKLFVEKKEDFIRIITGE